MKKILIVDDEVEILAALRLVLEVRDFLVSTISDPRLIDEAMSQMSPDIIFVDLSMPGLDGSEVTQKLKVDPKTANIPVVVMSAHTDTEQRATSAGADGYLEKPFQVKDFLAKISELT